MIWKTSIFLIFSFLGINSVFAQTTFYKTTDGILMTEGNYLQIKKEMNEREDLAGKYQEIFIKTENRNDTLIKTIKFERIMMAVGENKKGYDPYAEQRKLIGSHFPIEMFKDESGNNFSSDYLNGKPSVINFWFTDCPPCIEEIPDLNKMKKEFGDSFNYLAITFEKKEKIQKFLKKKRSFNFTHITDSKRQIEDLKIKSFPVTIILNNEGKVINIYGGTLFFQRENLYELLNFLR